MKRFSIPNISIPNISIPNISIGGGIDAGAIKSAISSAVPELSNLTNGLNIESIASSMLSDAVGGIDIPPELKDLL